jgi:hypothetical protein
MCPVMAGNARTVLTDEPTWRAIAASPSSMTLKTAKLRRADMDRRIDNPPSSGRSGGRP